MGFKLYDLIPKVIREKTHTFDFKDQDVAKFFGQGVPPFVKRDIPAAFQAAFPGTTPEMSLAKATKAATAAGHPFDFTAAFAEMSDFFSDSKVDPPELKTLVDFLNAGRDIIAKNPANADGAWAKFSKGALAAWPKDASVKAAIDGIESKMTSLPGKGGDSFHGV